jgi:hypothetical protein
VHIELVAGLDAALQDEEAKVEVAERAQLKRTPERSDAEAPDEAQGVAA